MITLTIKNLKTKKNAIECFASKDEAEKKLEKIITDSKHKNANADEYLEAWSYDTESEKSLIETYLPDDRKSKRAS